MLEGIIIKGISSFYYVEIGNQLYECKARGIFRKSNKTPLVGDRVLISVVDEEEKKGVIEEIFERKTELKRPPVANIEKIMLVFAVKEPTPNLTLLDKFIVFSERENLEVIIVLTKIDLDENYEITNKIKEEYENIGYKVISVSAENGHNIDQIVKELKNTITVFVGQSGVGKSSILNAINPELDLKTASISQKLGRGKHTTRHAELYKITDDSIVADTPGFSSYILDEIDTEELKEYFIEFNEYDDCRFGGKCLHKGEPNCSVKEAVESGKISKRRYESYLYLLNEIENNKKNWR